MAKKTKNDLLTKLNPLMPTLKAPVTKKTVTPLVVAKKAAGYQYAMPELPKKKVTPKVTPVMQPFTNEALINQQKAKYAIAQANNDYLGKRIANVEANKIRAAIKAPLYSSAVGDAQAARTIAKTPTALRQNIARTIAAKPLPKLPTINKNTMPTSYIPTTQTQDMGALIKRLEASKAKRIGAGAIKGFTPIAANYAPEVEKYLSNSSGYKAGNVIGTLASFATGYGLAGKAVTTGAKKIAPKLLPKAETAATRLVQKLVPKVAEETASKVGKGIVQSGVKDIAIGLPLNVNYAANKEGLRGKELAKSIALNTALDIGLGSALEFAPMILKSGKKINSVEDLKTLTPSEKIEVARLNPTRKALKTSYDDIASQIDTEYQKAINSVYDYIKDYKGKGTSTEIVPKNGDELMRDGYVKYTYSLNDMWYRDFYKTSGRKPNKSELRELAEEIVDDSINNGTPQQEFYFEDLMNGFDRLNKWEKGRTFSGNVKPLNRENQAVQPQNINLGTKLPQAQNIAQNGVLPRASEVNKLQPTLPRASKVVQPLKLQPRLKTASEAMAEQPRFKDLGADVNRFEEKAMALTNSTQIKPSKLEKLSGITSEVKRKFVDSGDTVAKISRINNDDGLYNLYNNAKNARRRAEYQIGEAQTDIAGKEIGKSLKSIFEPIRKKGENYYEDFQEYMYHLHNIDRMAQEKPVFGNFVTADESNLVANSLLQKYPEFANYGQEVRNYLDNLMQYRVQGGLISEDNAKIMAEMYKNYVPTYRANPSTRGVGAFGNTARVSQGVKKAVGSNKDLLPLHEQISKQTMQAVDAAHKNLFGIRLVENINPKTAQYIQELKKIDGAFDVDADVLPELKNSFTIYNKGTAYEAKVDKGLYEGIKALAGREPNELLDLATKGNAAFKELITSWNPAFLIRNFARDLQDVGLYTKNLKEFSKTYPAAVKEITTNGDIWKQYKALGGAGNSFFDYAKGYKSDSKWLKKNTLDRIEALNQGVEQAPRLAEFMSTIKKLGKEPTYDDLMQAMYNSADVTVNFGRSGTWGKTLNSTFVPFFNPAVQGTSKLVRRFTETKGVKDWTNLVMRVTALGVAPSLINEMVYHNDPEYAQLQDNVKDTNYVFKLGNGEWVKIPKGRVLSLFGSTAQRTYRAAKGEENAYAGLIKTGMAQSAPINPFESNIASPIALAASGRTWYGSNIEPQRVESLRPSQRYTEGTTELSKRIVGVAGKVADKANFSPMKLDYILDAYSGVIGDFGMPLMTPKAETNPLKKAFVVDSVTQNRISNDFYNAKQEITYNKNDETATLTDDVMNRYMSKVQGELSDMYKESREIQNSKNPDSYKKLQTRKNQQQINQIELSALSKLKNIKEVSDKLSKKYDDLDELSREVNKEVFGSEYALKNYNKNVYGKAQWAKENGVDYDTFYDTYFMAKANNEDGKGAIKRREAIQAMKQLEVTPKEKQRMIQALFLSEKERERIANR